MKWRWPNAERDERLRVEREARVAEESVAADNLRRIAEIMLDTKLKLTAIAGVAEAEVRALRLDALYERGGPATALGREIVTKTKAEARAAAEANADLIWSLGPQL